LDREQDSVRVQRRFERRRAPSIIVAGIIAFLVIALVKPWSFGPDRSDGTRPGSSGSIAAASALLAAAATPAVATPPPTPTPVPDPNAMACLTDETEQIVLIERWAGNEVRSWVASADVLATGPLDPRLVPVTVFSSHVIGLGVCAPRAQLGAQRPAARLLEIFSIVRATDGNHAIDLGPPEVITVQPSGPEPAVLYGVPRAALPNPSPGGSIVPPPVRSASPSGVPARSPDIAPAPDAWATWPTGSYAIGFRFPSDDPNLVRWLRVDLSKGAGGG
jgi:hypothetical protein